MVKARVAPRAGLLGCVLVSPLVLAGERLDAAGASAPPAQGVPVLDAAALAARSPVAVSVPAPAILDWARGQVPYWRTPEDQQIRVRSNRPVVALGDAGMLAAKDLLVVEPLEKGRSHR